VGPGAEGPGAGSDDPPASGRPGRSAGESPAGPPGRRWQRPGRPWAWAGSRTARGPSQIHLFRVRVKFEQRAAPPQTVRAVQQSARPPRHPQAAGGAGKARLRPLAPPAPGQLGCGHAAVTARLSRALRKIAVRVCDLQTRKYTHFCKKNCDLRLARWLLPESQLPTSCGLSLTCPLVSFLERKNDPTEECCFDSGNTNLLF
jgi:hypothetical protein